MNMRNVFDSTKTAKPSSDVPDYSEHEAKFKDRHASFLKEIEVANKEVSSGFSFLETVDAKDVVKKEEKSPKKVEEKSEVVVESSDVAEPMSGSVTKKPAPYREEFPLSSEDPFDDITPNPAPAKLLENELFGETSTTTPPAPKPEEKKADPKTLKTAIGDVELKQTQKEEVKESSKSSDAFDMEKFNPTKNSIDTLLEEVDVKDINAKLQSLSSYVVRMELDHARENPDRLWDLMVEVRNKMDSLHALLVELGPLENTFDHSIKRLRAVGNSCSKASSKEKRDGEVELLIGELLNHQNRINRVYDTAKFSYEHLKGQQEMLSRMVSFLAMRIGPEPKIFNQPESKTVVSEPQVQQPTEVKKTEPVEVKKSEPEKMQKPVEAQACASKHESLESFDVTKIQKPKSADSDGATHVIDW